MSQSRDNTTNSPNISPAEAAWLRYYYSETDKEQNKHVIAVAAATVAAAAKAAVAMFRLTSHGRGTMFGGGQERWAAVKIQTFVRGCLARKALRALRGLVKLQTHVRVYLIRKQATATLHSMQALIRAQATVRSQRVARGLNLQERFDETRSEHTVSIHTRRLSLNKMMESRSSLSGIRMQRSCSQVQEAINFKNTVMGKLDRSTEC